MIHLTILNLKEKLFEGEVSSVTLPGEQGELTVLPNHVPIITAIKEGVISALLDERERYAGEERKHIESKGGIFEFSDNKATVLL